MKTFTKSIIPLITAVIILSSCDRGTGCPSMTQVKHNKQQYRSQVTKDKKHFDNYKGFN